MHNTSSGKTRTVESDSDTLNFSVKSFDLLGFLGMAPVSLEIDRNLGSVLWADIFSFAGCPRFKKWIFRQFKIGALMFQLRLHELISRKNFHYSDFFVKSAVIWRKNLLFLLLITLSPIFQESAKVMYLLFILFWKHYFCAVVLKVALSIERICCCFRETFLNSNQWLCSSLLSTFWNEIELWFFFKSYQNLVRTRIFSWSMSWILNNL